MFTVKFYKFDEETGSDVWDVVSAPHYQISKRQGCSLVATYSDVTSKNGAERRIVGDDKHGYDACFIENSAGKTIEHLEAPPPGNP